MFISVLKWHFINKHIVKNTEMIPLPPDLLQFFSGFLELLPRCTGYLCSSSFFCPKQPLEVQCTTPATRKADRLFLHITYILPIFDSSRITLVWLSCKSVDFDWIEIYIISSWEFWRLVTHCTESVISLLFFFHSRINPDMLLHTSVPDIFSIHFWFRKKSHHRRCTYSCYLAVVKKERTPKSTSPFLIFVKMKEILIKLFDKSFPFYTVPEKEIECTCGWRQWHSYDRLQT